MPADALRVEVVDNPAVLATWREAWDRLVKTAPARSAAQSFAYAQAGWAAWGETSERLAVILVHRRGELAAVWPLHVVRKGPVRVARHLGCGGMEEYADPLIAPGPARTAVARAIYEAACGLADVLEAYNLSPDSPVDALLRADRRPRFGGPMVSPVVACAGAGDWEAWGRTKSKSFRSGLRYDRKRLAADAPVAFREVPADEAEAFVAWIFAHKRRWLAGGGRHSHWLGAPQAEAFFAALVGREGSGVLGFVLERDGTPVAGGICLRADPCLEFYVSALDPAFMSWSPGNLLIEDLVRWAIARGLDFDFRLTREPYKLRWTDTDREVTTHWLACTPRGALTVRRRQLHEATVALRMRAKAALRRVAS